MSPYLAPHAAHQRLEINRALFQQEHRALNLGAAALQFAKKVHL